jgi:hypothetical protein
LDEKDRECEIRCEIKHFHEAPGWRNWQTQRTQKRQGIQNRVRLRLILSLIFSNIPRRSQFRRGEEMFGFVSRCLGLSVTERYTVRASKRSKRVIAWFQQLTSVVGIGDALTDHFLFPDHILCNDIALRRSQIPCGE